METALSVRFFGELALLRQDISIPTLYQRHAHRLLTYLVLRNLTTRTTGRDSLDVNAVEATEALEIGEESLRQAIKVLRRCLGESERERLSVRRFTIRLDATGIAIDLFRFLDQAQSRSLQDQEQAIRLFHKGELLAGWRRDDPLFTTIQALRQETANLCARLLTDRVRRALNASETGLIVHYGEQFTALATKYPQSVSMEESLWADLAEFAVENGLSEKAEAFIDTFVQWEQASKRRGLIRVRQRLAMVRKAVEKQLRAGISASEPTENTANVHYMLALHRANDALGDFNRGLAERILDSVVPETPRFEWSYLKARCRDSALSQISSWGDAPACDLDINATGTVLAIAALDGTVHLLDTTSARAIQTIAGDFPAQSVSFFPDGQRLAIGYVNGRFRIVDWKYYRILADGSAIPNLRSDIKDAFCLARVSPDGSFLAIAGRRFAPFLLNIATGERRSLLLTESVHTTACLAFLPDGGTLLAGTDNAIAICDVQTGLQRNRLNGHSEQVTSLAVSPDGDYLVSGGADSKAILWDLNNNRLRTVFTGHSDRVYAVAFSPEGRYVATGGGDGRILLWSAIDGISIDALSGHHDPVRAIRFYPFSHIMYSAGDEAGLRIWHISAPTSGRLDGHTRKINAFLLDHKEGQVQLFAAGNDGGVRRHDLNDQSQTTFLEDCSSPVCAMTLSSEKRWLFTGHRDGTIRRLSTATLQVEFTWQAHEGRISALQSTDNPSVLISASWDGTVRWWSDATGFEIPEPDAVRNEHSGWVTDLALTPDGEQFATSNQDGTVTLWSTKDREPVMRLPLQEFVSTVAFSSDSKRLAIGDDTNMIKIWDKERGAFTHDLEGHTNGVECLAFLPGDDRLVSGSRDGTLRIWDTDTADLLLTIRPQISWITTLAVSPDGKTLIIGGSLGQIRVLRTI